ncbi:MAG: hypothetical protein JWN50_24, partial [Parcubacteria group bacterium]|nr:hypothetical protein [Parcubacteria group bacterium]
PRKESYASKTVDEAMEDLNLD